MNNTGFDRTIERLRHVATAFAPFSRRFPQQVQALGDLVPQLEGGLADLRQDRKLRIGIVGQINAGKSSLLNALLFDGQELLAKAATPMTASLTYLRYGDRPRAVVEFYDRDEWSSITQLAAGDAAGSPQVEAAQKQLSMAKSKGLDVNQWLGQKPELETQDPLELVKRLRDYIGADGTYTPIVKCLSLEMPVPALAELEIIDTPGLNDPVHARSLRTRKDMAKCDVVFLLSYTGKFLDNVDMQLLSQHLPHDAVARVVLLGTKFDSALMDVCFDYDGPQQAIAGARKDLLAQAQDVLGRYQSELTPDDPAHRLLEGLRQPVLISAMSAMIHAHEGRWTAEEAELHQKLADLWPGNPLTVADLGAIGNLEKVHEHLAAIAKTKDEVLAQRLGELAGGKEREAVAHLESLRADAAKNLQVLERSTADQLSRQQEHLKTIEKASDKVEQVFDELIERAHAERLKVFKKLEATKKSFSNLQVQTGNKAETYTVKETRYRQKKVLWIIPWGEEAYTVDVQKTRTVSYQYAEVDDAIDAVERFAGEARESIKRTINGLVDRKILRNRLKAAVLETFDASDPNFDVALIGRALERAADRMVIPEIDLSGADYAKMVSRNFSGEVKEGDIALLRSHMQEAINQVVDDLDTRFRNETGNFEQALKTNRLSFLDDVLAAIHQDLEQLKKELERGEVEVQGYRDLIKLVDVELQMAKALV